MKDHGKDTVHIYTDGSCSGNPGPGGWGVLLRWRGVEKEMSGGEAATTNNRMELTAVIEALRALKGPSVVALYTDSQYVQKAMTEWLANWKAKDYRVKGGGLRKNHDLWRQLDELSRRHRVRWHWVRGHAGDPGNERADELARRGMEEARNGAAADTKVSD